MLSDGLPEAVISVSLKITGSFVLKASLFISIPAAIIILNRLKLNCVPFKFRIVRVSYFINCGILFL